MISKEFTDAVKTVLREELMLISNDLTCHIHYYDQALHNVGWRQHATPPRAGEYEELDGVRYRVLSVVWKQGTRGERIANVYMERVT